MNIPEPEKLQEKLWEGHRGYIDKTFEQYPQLESLKPLFESVMHASYKLGFGDGMATVKELLVKIAKEEILKN